MTGVQTCALPIFICIPWGDKFNMFKHPPVMATERNWTEKMSRVKYYPDALHECRSANREFFNDVSKLIGKSINKKRSEQSMNDEQIEQYIETYIKKW